MKYALNIDSKTNAVLSATYEQFAWEGCVLVDHLPEGDITDYDFIDGEYVLNEERKKAREEQKDVKSTEEIYAEALNMLGVETEVTESAE
jgi:hypothetical protein